MATRRRVGFSTSTSEASRRQLMQPVPCWEKIWGPPDGAPPGTTLRVYKWVKTDKKQQFSDDEGEADQPLAPLQPEDLVEVDDEMDQDEAAGSTAPDMTPGPMSRDVSEPAPSRPSKEGEDDGLSKPATPKPHPLSISFQPPTPTPVPDEDELLPPQEDVVDMGADMDADMAPDFGADISLDMAGMGPDGEQFEGAEDMSQLQSADPLLGGPLINEEIGDPFAVPPA